MVAWFAFAIVISTSGVQYFGSPTIYETKEECVVANQKVEDSVMKQAKAPEGVVSYRFECLPYKPEDFKKPGMDA